MRIGICLGYQSSTLGGAHTFENEIFQSLVDFGTESGYTFVLCDFQKNPPAGLPIASHIEWASLYRSYTEQFQSKISRVIKNLINSLKPSKNKFKVLNGYEETIQNFKSIHKIDALWLFAPYGLDMDIPYIVTVWDLEHRTQPYFPEVSSGGGWEIREKHYETFLRKAAFIFVGTQTGKAEIEKFYQVPSERIKVIPFPTPRMAPTGASHLEKNILEKYSIPDNYLFYPARFFPHKNHANLLLAIRLLNEKYGYEFPVVFVGSDAGNESYIKAFATELGLNKQIHFLGFVPREDLSALYEHAFALTCVTFFGPDNLPPLEAFSLGCPVVASKVSGAEEQLGDAALLVDPKDPEHIASAIASLWEDDSLRQRLIQSGFERANFCTGKDYIQNVFMVLNELKSIRRCWN